MSSVTPIASRRWLKVGPQDRPSGKGANRADPAGAGPQPGPARLSERASRLLRAARLWITLNRPYYSRALFACPMIPADGVETMSIDERWRIYVNSGFVERHTVEQTAAVLIHELNHGLRDHSGRARTVGVGAGAALVWNAAADCEINDDLIEDGLDPPGGLLPDTLDLDDFCTAEQYYRELMEQATVIGMGLQCGSGCTGHGAPHESGPHESDLRGAAGPSEVERESLRRITSVAVAEHERSTGHGSVPAGLRRWADDTLNPKVNWRRVLASAVRRGLHLRTGAADYSWQRPSRRDQADALVIRPGMTRPVPDIAVVIDTSGSMGDRDLARALAEIRAILTKVVPGEAVRVYSVDAEAASAEQVFNIRQINLAGGGGTDMRAGIAAAAATRPAVIIVITDGYTPWPDTRPPGVPVTIAALTTHRTLGRVPEWIKAIDIAAGEQ